MNDSIVKATINKYFVCPKLTANLFSVKYLANKLNILTIFDVNTCKLIVKHDHKILPTVTSTDNTLYYLDTKRSPALICSKKESNNTWHKRIAHLFWVILYTED